MEDKVSHDAIMHEYGTGRTQAYAKLINVVLMPLREQEATSSGGDAKSKNLKY